MALVKDRDKDVASDTLAPTADGPDDHGPERPVRSRQSHGFFTVYKKGQGYWTRMGTAIGAAILIAVLALYTFSETKALIQLKQWNTPRLPLITTGAVIAIGALIAWWLMNKPRNADFLIATDGEMNKVNWTSRKELIGSTKIVILFMFAIALVLFLIDIITGGFFQMIGLLRVGPLF